MKVSELDLKKKHIENQLHKKGFTQTEGLTYNELKHKLAVIRYMEVDVEKSENQYF